MSSNKAAENAGRGGTGFLTLLTLVFVAAKLWDKIDWSWWWVFAPIWGPFAIAAAIAVMAAFICGIMSICKAK